MGAYAEALPVFREHGIQIYPTRADAPTVSMVKGPSKFRAQEVSPRFANANAAFIAGNDNNITIVDIDAEGNYYPDMIAEMCGETPYIVKTPSGGTHMGYRYNGERRSVRAFGDNIPIDLLGGGTVVVPPSIRPAREDKCAGEYRSIGDLGGALAALPTIRKGLPPELYERSRTTHLPGVGDRNETLFRHARRLAAKAMSEADLVEALLRENEHLAEPLSADEVQRIARSAWKYKLEGRLLLPGSRTGFASLAEIELMNGNPSALALLVYLRSHHPQGHVFAISADGIARSGALRLAPKTIRRAREILIEEGLLEEVSPVRWESDKRHPAQYRLSES